MHSGRFTAVIGWLGGLALIFVPAASVAQARCGGSGPATAASAVEGTLILRDGRPASGAKLSAVWQAASGTGSKSISGMADSAGRYLLCGIPAGATIDLRIALKSEEWLVSNIPTQPGAAIRQDLRLYPAPPLLSVTSGSTPNASPGVLRGFVYDENGAPMPGVSVRVHGSEIADITGADGRFLIPGVPAGRYSLEARALGFSPLQAFGSLGSGDTARVNFILNRFVPRLAEVLTVGEPTAFERTTGFGERRRRGNGLFFDRAAIEQRGSHRITDLVRGIPGFTLQPVFGRWGQTYDVRMDRAAASGGKVCPIDYFINGNEYTPTSAGIDHDFPAQQVEAVEVYRPSEVPAQFSGQRARCGVILIWTRYHAYDIP